MKWKDSSSKKIFTKKNTARMTGIKQRSGKILLEPKIGLSLGVAQMIDFLVLVVTVFLADSHVFYTGSKPARAVIHSSSLLLSVTKIFHWSDSLLKRRLQTSCLWSLDLWESLLYLHSSFLGVQDYW